jgi:hypothetical protein
MKIRFPAQISKNFQTNKSMITRPVEAVLFDKFRHDESRSHFSQLWEQVENVWGNRNDLLVHCVTFAAVRDWPFLDNTLLATKKERDLVMSLMVGELTRSLTEVCSVDPLRLWGHDGEINGCDGLLELTLLGRVLDVMVWWVAGVNCVRAGQWM